MHLRSGTKVRKCICAWVVNCANGCADILKCANGCAGLLKYANGFFLLSYYSQGIAIAIAIASYNPQNCKNFLKRIYDRI
jgi:hypothetical protein